MSKAPSKPRPPRTLSTSALVVYAFALALGLGVSSAYFAVSGEYPLGGVAVGPWKTWPKTGSRDADPYARTIVVRSGDVPLATGEGLGLTASLDSDGRPLDSACTYQLGSATPQARLWTLTLYDQGGGLIASDLQRSGFTSSEILRDADGRFTVSLSRDLQPGNWLKLPSAGPFSLALRLYDTPASTGTASLDVRALPRIERVACGA
ncbi:MAG TPA: DUF1214 domain-containing protein [Microvirga sp.]